MYVAEHKAPGGMEQRMRPGDCLVFQRSAGFTYVATLMALAIFGIGLAALGESWSAASRREREENLQQIGAEYVRAIASYYERSPGAVKNYPQHLEDLVDDKRFVSVMRHLRKVYRDPIAPSSDWGLVRAPDGGISGIYSTSELGTLQKQPLVLDQTAPIEGARYSDWKFVYQPKS